MLEDLRASFLTIPSLWAEIYEKRCGWKKTRPLYLSGWCSMDFCNFLPLCSFFLSWNSLVHVCVCGQSVLCSPLLSQTQPSTVARCQYLDAVTEWPPELLYHIMMVNIDGEGLQCHKRNETALQTDMSLRPLQVVPFSARLWPYLFLFFPHFSPPLIRFIDKFCNFHSTFG